jgi:hypothetical protein
MKKSVIVFVALLFLCLIGFVSAFSGDGSFGNPYVITNCTELNETRNDLTANYSLGNDINMSLAGCEDFQTGTGFEPIGNSLAIFTGSFNGWGNVISNLFINLPETDNVGLFGYSEYANISNLGLINFTIFGNNYVGGLAGSFYYGAISNSFASGNVNWENGVEILAMEFEEDSSFSLIGISGLGDPVGRWKGGLVGSIYESSIDNSYATGNVNGTAGVGGLVGLFDGQTITNSYSAGNVSASESGGGLVGYVNGGNISDSYASGNVFATETAGGLVGIFKEYSSVPFIINSYSTGNVSGSNSMSGLVGFNEAGIIINSYWYNQSQGLNCSDVGNDGCTAISNLSYFYNYNNSPMNLTSGDGWNFVSIWSNLFNEENFPVFQWQNASAVIESVVESVVEIQQVNSGGGSAPAKIVSSESINGGETQILAYGTKMILSFKEENHTIWLRQINRDKAEIVIDVYSEKQNISLAVGETKEVDLDSDGIKDYKISLLKIYDNSVKVDLKIEEIKLVVEEENKTLVGETVKNVVTEIKEKNYFGWFAGVLIVVVAVTFVLWKRGKFNRNY